MPTPVVLVSLSENKMVTVFSCVGSSRVGDPPWMENAGSIAAIVLPYDATLCSGFAPCGQGPPGCYTAMMSLIGSSGGAAATLVLMGGLARCWLSPCFQSLWMRLSAAMLAAVVDGFSELVDDGKMELAAIVGDLSSVSAMQQLALEDEVKVSSSCSLISSCNKGTKSFLKIVKNSGWKDMFPLFESGCSFWTAGVLLDGLAALCGLCWMELSLEHSVATAGIFPCAWYDSAAAVAASAVEFDGSEFNSGSCIEADDCHGSSSNEASTSGDESEKKEEMLQFFVNYGKGSVVVRCSPHLIASHVLHYGCEEYAVCGTRTLRSNDTLLQNGIESGMTVRVLCRLRGGSGGNVNVDIPSSGSAIFVTRLGVGLRENDATGATLLAISPTLTVQFVDHWAGRSNRHATMCLQQGVLDQGRRQLHHGTLGMGLRLGLGWDPCLRMLGKRMKGEIWRRL